MSALVAPALARFGRVDCLVNNAGIGGVPGEIHALDLGDAYARTVGVLLTGVIAGTKHAARVMRAQRAGSIVNIASVAGLAAGYGEHVYSALKAAVLSLTRTAGAELGPFGVRVNAICPGGIATPMFVGGADAPREDLPRAMEGVRALLGRVQPIPRCGEPEDVAQAAVFLASDESTFMTGQAVVVDGGLLAGAGARAMAEALRGGVDGGGPARSRDGSS